MGVSRSSVLAMAYMILVRQWAVLDVVREFRKRRDVRPNDDFIDQIVCLHNKFVRNKSGCLAAQKKLSDLPDLARPWHWEFWSKPPLQSDLPFTLRHLGDRTRDPLTDNIAALNTDINPREIVSQDQAENPPPHTELLNFQHIMLASADPFKIASEVTQRSRSDSESSWEYYTETESEPEPE